MLVLSRKREESVIIRLTEDMLKGTEIRVTVVDIRGDKIRLGFAAPMEVSIHREEVQEQVDRDAAAYQNANRNQPPLRGQAERLSDREDGVPPPT